MIPTIPLTLMLGGVLAAPAIGTAQETVAILVESEDDARSNAIVRATLPMPKALAESSIVRLKSDAGLALLGQLGAPSPAGGPERTTGSKTVLRDLIFTLPEIDAGERVRFEISQVNPASIAAHSGRWVETELGDRLIWNGRPVMEYVRPELDESSPERRELTYKPFHHLFAPGGRRVTKGPGGRFSHHRGLFFGFNRITYGDGRSADVWHCRGDAFQSHEETLALEAGPVFGRNRVVIDWHGEEGEVFATEIREVTAYLLETARVYEFKSWLRTRVGPVRLDGDPQHAGVQFRADNQVASSTNEQTYYIRPDGPGRPGETRNWNPGSGAGPVNLPWNGMSFVLDGQRYTALYLDHPSNPKEARYSERDYGRFGSYFEYDLDEDEPLRVTYRLWLLQGETTVEAAQAVDRDFDRPVTVRIVD